MVSVKWLIIGLNILTLIGWSGISEVEGAFPLIFPFLTSGWYYKPTPTESVFLGLILIKVLAIRLASATGFLPIPYHLNDLFLRSLGKRSIGENTHANGTIPFGITSGEFKTIERVLLSLRRIDSNDCFIRLICEMNQDSLSGKEDHSQFLNVFRVRKTFQIKNNEPLKSKHWSIWNIYENVTNPEIKDCHKMFPSCPCSKQELQFDALLTGVF